VRRPGGERRGGVEHGVTREPDGHLRAFEQDLAVDEQQAAVDRAGS
jgi:hypothetical protein